MRMNRRQSGVTLTELLVVVSVMAILMAIAVPAVKGIMESFDSTTSVRQLISAALSNARAIAIREQTYAGIRFQQDYKGDGYMIFIIHDPNATGLANGFKSLPGRKPMKLPQDVGVATSTWNDRRNFYTPPYDSDNIITKSLDSTVLSDNISNLVTIGNSDCNLYLLDATTFSVIFSPQGKLVTQPVWIRSNDAIFNGYNAPNYIGQFLQDDFGDSPNFGIGPEKSVQSFLLYSKKDYNAAPQNLRWTNCLSKSTAEYVSPYTGELMIEYRNAQMP